MSGSKPDITMQASVNGNLVEIPMGSANVQTPQEALSGQGAYECSGDTLTVTNQGVQSIWNRQS
jgi:hypothetical protein